MSAFSGIEISIQINQINAMMKKQITEAKNIKANIRAFVNNSGLQSEAYTNQKEYFDTVYISLYNGIEQFANEFIEANRRLQNQYLYVDNDISAYVNTDILQQELGTIIANFNYWVYQVGTHPFAQYYTDLNRNMWSRVQAVIDRMNCFTENTSTNYGEAKTYLNYVISGMNEIENDCWDTTKGEFNISAINTDWTNLINDIYYAKTCEGYGLTEERLNYLHNIGYANKDIVELMETYNDTDKEFLLEILKGNYDDAFLSDPDTISQDAYLLVSDYLSKLVDKEDLNELEKVINSLAMSDDSLYKGSKEQQHLENIIVANKTAIIAYQTELGARDDALDIMNNNLADGEEKTLITKEMQELCAKLDSIMKLDSLLMIVDYYTINSDLFPKPYLEAYGAQDGVMMGMQIKDLKITDTGAFAFDYQYQLGITNKTTGETLPRPHLSTDWENGSSDIDSDTLSDLHNAYIDRLDELSKKAEEAIYDFILNVSVTTLTLINPALGATAAVVKAVYKEKIGDAAGNSAKVGKESIANLTDEQKKTLGDVATEFSFIQEILNLYNSFQKIKSEEEGESKKHLLQFFGADSILINGDTVHIYQTNGERFLTMYRWQKHGIGAIASDENKKTWDNFAAEINKGSIQKSLETYLNLENDKKDVDVIELEKVVKQIINGGIDFSSYYLEDEISTEDIKLLSCAFDYINERIQENEFFGNGNYSILTEYNNYIDSLSK